jgi:cytochrome c peroxidase
MKSPFRLYRGPIGVAGLVLAATFISSANADQPDRLEDRLARALREAGFTGRVQESLEPRLGRRLDPKRVKLGRTIFFDNIMGLHRDNACAGCHSPAAGFGDSQSIAIGTDNNGVVGPDRTGPRNQRRAPLTINTAFSPSLMLNLRFVSRSGDPFDLSPGASVPFSIGGDTVWNPSSACFYATCFDAKKMTTLLTVQGHFPPTELIEMAGFTAEVPGDVDPALYHPSHRVSSGAFSDTVPGPIAGPNGSPPDSFDTSYSIRQKVLDRFNANAEYVSRFKRIYPEADGGKITFAMIGAALAEFQMANTFANAPLDRFARGHRHALTAAQQRGALLFFTTGKCVSCHGVAGVSNEMFTDFDNYVAGIPQIAPKDFGLRPSGDPLNPDDFPGNFAFSGPASDEDFGREEVTGNPADRYKFRTSPLRNIALQAAFFHNGSFTKLEEALRYHLDTLDLAPSYDAAAAGVDADLTVRKGPLQPVLDRLEPRIAALGDLNLSPREFQDLLAFLRDGLLDPDARPEKLCKQIPETVPSGLKVLEFQGCPAHRGADEGPEHEED